jgi:hypothetical protein
MKIIIGTILLGIATLTSASEETFILRVEQTELLSSKGEPVARVTRNEDGNVVRLRLTGMQLSAEDFEALGRITSLEYLTLFRTNVTNADLKILEKLKNLKWLNLTETEVSDAAVEKIKLLPDLRSLCLGGVAIKPESVADLKAHFPRLAVGYVQLKD